MYSTYEPERHLMKARGGRGGGRAGRASRSRSYSKSKRASTVKNKRYSKYRKSKRGYNNNTMKGDTNSSTLLDGVMKRIKVKKQYGYPRVDKKSLRNFANGQVSIDTGTTSNQVCTWVSGAQGTCSNTAGDVGTLQAATKMLNLNANGRIIFTKIYAHAEVTNQTTSSVNFTAYVLRCREDTNTDPLSAWSTGLSNDMSNITGTLSGIVYTAITRSTLYQKPYSSMLFNRLWKVISEKEYTIGAGGSCKIGFSNSKLPLRALSQYEAGVTNYMRGYAMALLIVARGNAYDLGSGVGSGTNATTGNGKLVMVTHQCAYYRVPQSNNPTIGWVTSAMPAINQTVEEVLKDADTVAAIATT
nr:MAG: capsid protein [Cressdnaviricota sp.]